MAFIKFSQFARLPWRNWLARSAVNRKVGGSSPPGSGVLKRSLKTEKKEKKDLTNR